jgi:hypothetical protein
VGEARVAAVERVEEVLGGSMTVWAMARVTAAEIGPVVLDGGVVCHVDGPSVTVCARNAAIGGLEISGPYRELVSLLSEMQKAVVQAVLR